MSQAVEHAIRECLANMSAEFLGTERGALPFRMRTDTVRFVKKRETPPHQLWYVTCDAEGGQSDKTHWHWTVLITQDELGQWRATGVAGGSGDSPVLGYPWANLGGNWGSDGFRAGGTVEDAGKGVAWVRLTDVEGRTFEDTVNDGVVLFMSDETVMMPLHVELYDANGRVVATDEWGSRDE